MSTRHSVHLVSSGLAPNVIFRAHSTVTFRLVAPFSAIPKLANVAPYALSTPPNPSSTRKAIELGPYREVMVSAR